MWVFGNDLREVVYVEMLSKTGLLPKLSSMVESIETWPA
jgi:hypothetical protein